MTDLSAQDVAAAMGLTVPQPQPRKTSTSSSPTADLARISKERRVYGQKALAEEDAAYAAAKKESDEAKEKVQPITETPRPQLQQSDPLESFFSLGSVFGILATAFTHTPWYNGVNAAAAAINARNQGDMERYQEKLKEWRENTDMMFKRHDQQMADWKAIMESNKDDLAARDALMRAHFAEYGDEASLAFQQAGLEIQGANLALRRQEVASELKERYYDLLPKLAESIPQMQLIDALKKNDAPAAQTALKEIQAIRAANAGAPAREFTDPKPAEVKTPDGKTTRANVIYDRQHFQWVDAATGKPITGEVTITKEETGGGRAQTMLQRQLVDAADIVKDVKNVMELPITASTGWFGFGERKGILDVTKAALVNSTVTRQEVQDFNAQLSGMGRALAGLETGGLQANQGLVKSFEGLALNAGDSQVTKLRKLALMRQYTENALEAALTNPLMSQKEQDYATGLLKELSGSIPFTVHDVTALEQSKNPQETISDVARAQGLGGKKSYAIGDIIRRGNKEYRVIGIADPTNPTIEEVVRR